MTADIQTVPARHGIATFVPRDHSLKVINTYGTQTVDLWAFALHKPPQDEEREEERRAAEEEIRSAQDEAAAATEEKEKKEKSEKSRDRRDSLAETEDREAQAVKKDDDDDSGQETEKQCATAATERQEEEEKGTTDNNDTMSASVMSTKSWGSYLPSIRRGNIKGLHTSPTAKKKANAKGKGWLSYIPSGKSFSSYLPSSGKEALSAFAASHHRDPTKSYAEQLYEFSKTPVGAFSLSAAAGSGTAGSLYAAYNAYVKLAATRRISEPMEYLSLPHSVAASTHLSPQPGDALVTNLRKPLLTLLADTSPLPNSTTSTTSSASDDGTGTTVPLRHGTLLPACDPPLYKQLATLAGRARGEEHGSCAENLVLALQSFNASAGLKGARAVGADVTINSMPTPLSLFLNCGVCASSAGQEKDLDPGEGAAGEGRGAADGVAEVRGGWVLFRAERDIVVVLSACPMDVGDVNGGRCMAANFVVEEPAATDEEEGDDETERLERARAYGRALGAKVPRGRKPSAGGGGGDVVVDDAVRKCTETTSTTPEKSPRSGSQSQASSVAAEVRNRPRPGRRKPKKLERRSGGAEVK
ncbi:uncharacterized protein IWZ02DRAFT_377776 [Phyllosticta citriasiana]|uniref:uncharacterized protein n=1 Tax=Phyllosticta citriasiana TaxID=595635 RepID=UPI0030FD44B2